MLTAKGKNYEVDDLDAIVEEENNALMFPGLATGTSQVLVDMAEFIRLNNKPNPLSEGIDPVLTNLNDTLFDWTPKQNLDPISSDKVSFFPITLFFTALKITTDQVKTSINAIFNPETSLQEASSQKNSFFENFRNAVQRQDDLAIKKAIDDMQPFLDSQTQSYSKQDLITTLKSIRDSANDLEEKISAEIFLDRIENSSTKNQDSISNAEMAYLLREITASMIILPAELAEWDRRQQPLTSEYVEKEISRLEDEQKKLDQLENRTDLKELVSQAKELNKNLLSLLDSTSNSKGDDRHFVGVVEDIIAEYAIKLAPIMEQIESNISKYDEKQEDANQRPSLQYVKTDPFFTKARNTAKNNYVKAIRNASTEKDKTEAKKALGAVMIGQNATDEDKIAYADHYDKSRNYWLYQGKEQKDALQAMEKLAQEEKKAIYRRCGEMALGEQAKDETKILYGENEEKSRNYWLYQGKEQKDALKAMEELKENEEYRKVGATFLGSQAKEKANELYGKQQALYDKNEKESSNYWLYRGKDQTQALENMQSLKNNNDCLRKAAVYKNAYDTLEQWLSVSREDLIEHKRLKLSMELKGLELQPRNERGLYEKNRIEHIRETLNTDGAIETHIDKQIQRWNDSKNEMEKDLGEQTVMFIKRAFNKGEHVEAKQVTFRNELNNLRKQEHAQKQTKVREIIAKNSQHKGTNKQWQETITKIDVGGNVIMVKS